MDASSKVFRDLCTKNSVDPRLVAAIIETESSWVPWVVRYEPQFLYTVEVDRWAKAHRQSKATEQMLQRTSFGLMQLMGGTARGLGFEGNLTTLLVPELNVEWGCKLMAQLKQRYRDRDDQIAAYNAGAAKRDALTGEYRNQGYVDKVLRAFK
jgi:hypothetical protein